MSTSDICKICKDGASKSIVDGVCELKEKLQNMNTSDDNVSVCANCGKEGTSDNMNICNKCKQVTYCNAACKKKHRSKHKKACERRVAELHDEELFKQTPPEDCPICFLRIPTLQSGYKYYVCCGKVICCGCIHAPVYDHQGNEVDNEKCPFCRVPTPHTDEEMIGRLKKRVEAEDPIAIYNLGVCYRDGTYGFPQDHIKALELFHRAAELGDSKAYGSIGYAYLHGRGVEVDNKKKANHYYELSAMGGDDTARYNLGNNEIRAGNYDRALKHYMIAVRDGISNSLEAIKWLYSNGHATKEDYTKALRSYQTYLGEIKSEQRDEAAAADERNRYY